MTYLNSTWKNWILAATLLQLVSVTNVVADDEVSREQRQLPAKRSESRPVEFGSDRSTLGRLLRGPKPRIDASAEKAQLRFRGRQAGTIKLKNLRGGLVSYDVVEVLEAHLPVLNSPWFFEKVHRALEKHGVSPLQEQDPAYSTFKQLINVKRSRVRDSLKLIPEILDQDGDGIAESIFAELKKELELTQVEASSEAILRFVEKTGMTADQVRELRTYLVQQSLNEDELIDAFHLSTYKASHLVAMELKRATSLIRLGSRERTVNYTAAAAAATVGSSVWTYASVSTYLEQIATHGLQWGESFFYDSQVVDTLTYRDIEYMIDNEWTHRATELRESLESLRQLGFQNAEALLGRGSDLYVGIPYMEMGAAAASIMTLGYFAPKLWQQSQPYLALLRNQFLNGYLKLLRVQGVLTHDMAEKYRAEAAGLVALTETTDIDGSQFNFADASDIRQWSEQILNAGLPEIKQHGFATQIMLLAQPQMKLGTDILSHFTRDMAEWIVVARFYKTQLNGKVRTNGHLDFTGITETAQAYQSRLGALSQRIEAYEKVVADLDTRVLEALAVLENLLNDDNYKQYIEVRSNGLDDYDLRARQAIKDRISDLVAFRNGTLAIIRLSLRNAFTGNYDDSRDLQKLVRISSTNTLADTAARIGQLNQTVLDLMNRKVGEVVSRPDDADLVDITPVEEVAECVELFPKTENKN